MNWDAGRFQKQLSAALEKFEGAEVEKLCSELVRETNSGVAVADESFAKSVLSNLQRKRCFDQIIRVADALMQNGLESPGVRRQYAQALLDRGELSAAIPFLQQLERDLVGKGDEDQELSEARGLLGRAHKQTYVRIGAVANSNSQTTLNRAIRYYLSVYKTAPLRYSWHGINAAALLMRADRDGIEVDGIPTPAKLGTIIAEEVLSNMSTLWDNWRASMWDSGTAMEACVALGKREEAVVWLKRYVAEPQADAFELGSTLRQLEEIWKLRVDSSPGGQILPILRSELLLRQGGSFTADASQLRADSLAQAGGKDLEKVFGVARYHSYKFMQQCIDCARAVARIETSTGQGYGTGFLIRGSDLHASLDSGFLLVTNAHVVSDNPRVKDALSPGDAIVTFELLRQEGQAADEYSVSRLLWTSPPWELDATILQLESVPQGVKPFRVHSRLPLPNDEQRVYIIGHPKYRAPTEGGSSGSPVFNSQLKLIGLHHAGSNEMQRLNGKKGTYEANEGIWIQSVIRSLANQPPTSSVTQVIGP
jgi:hypothetical protein